MGRASGVRPLASEVATKSPTFVQGSDPVLEPQSPQKLGRDEAGQQETFGQAIASAKTMSIGTSMMPGGMGAAGPAQGWSPPSAASGTLIGVLPGLLHPSRRK